MLRNLLICGLLAGLCGGLLATGFAARRGRAAGRPAIAFEDAPGQGRRASPRRRRSSRATLQKSFGLLTAAVVYGLSLGGLFALAFACGVRPRRPRRARRGPRILLAAFAFVVVYLVPFVKYPANPPSVGDPDTIGKRTALYLIMILISLLAAVAAVRLRGAAGRALVGLDRDARSPAPATCSWWSWPGWALPPIQEVPKTFPAVTLFRFREASIGMQAVLWTTIGLVFAGHRAARHDRSDDHPAAPLAQRDRRPRRTEIRAGPGRAACRQLDQHARARAQRGRSLPRRA